jgi:hypothetical protein
MESDIVSKDLLDQAIYNTNLKGRVSVKRLLFHCGAKRTKETKTRGIWLTHVEIKDRNKWLLAKIKYGF